MVADPPTGATYLTYGILNWYFKRAMPSGWKLYYEISCINLLMSHTLFDTLSVFKFRGQQRKEIGRHTYATTDLIQALKTKYGSSKNQGRTSEIWKKNPSQNNQKRSNDERKWCKLQKRELHSYIEWFTQQQKHSTA